MTTQYFIPELKSKLTRRIHVHLTLMLGLIDQRKRLANAFVVRRDALSLYQGNLVTTTRRMVLTRSGHNSTSTNDDFFGHIVWC